MNRFALVVAALMSVLLVGHGTADDKGFKSSKPKPPAKRGFKSEPKIKKADPIPDRPKFVLPASSSNAAVSAAGVDVRHVVTVIVGDSCQPCHREQEAFPNGDSNVQFEFVNKVPKPVQRYDGRRWYLAEPKLPLHIWTDATGKERYHEGYSTPAEILALIERNDPPKKTVVSANVPVAGMLPTIDDLGYIRQGLDSINCWLGADVTFQLKLIRTGGKTDLLFNEEHSVCDIFGKSLKIVLDIKAPERSISIHHEMECEPESIRPNNGTVGSPLLLVWTLVSIGNNIYDLLHPQMSMFLPETIDIRAVAKSDSATVEFVGDPPNVQLRWEFWLGLIQYEYSRPLTGVTFSPSEVEAQFHQSKFYRELVFPVKPQTAAAVDQDDDPEDVPGYQGPTVDPKSVGATRSGRSPKWRAVRDRFFRENPRCAFKGCTYDGPHFSVHHLKPYHLFPELELDTSNLVTVCSGDDSPNHHLYVAHDGNFRNWNKDAGQHLTDGVYPANGKTLMEQHQRKQQQSKTLLSP